MDNGLSSVGMPGGGANPGGSFMMPPQPNNVVDEFQVPDIANPNIDSIRGDTIAMPPPSRKRNYIEMYDGKPPSNTNAIKKMKMDKNW